MADQELQELTEVTSFLPTDLAYLTIDPSGTPASRNIQLVNLGLTGGWISFGHTWAYASATTFTVSGDQTAYYRKGTKLTLSQSSATKYWSCAGSSYSAPNTTVTIIETSDYTLTNNTITANYVSYSENPEGWPWTFNWIPTIGGFSSAPTGGIYRFRVVGNRIECMIRQPNVGTSNDTVFTITAPVAALNLAGGVWTGFGVGVDNNITQASPSRIDIIGNLSTFTLFKTFGSASTDWTNSGNKRMASGTIFYPF